MYDAIAVIVIPFLVAGLKKIKLPVKFAPIAAFVLALIIVAGGKVAGLDLNVTTVMEAIIKALAISGISVLGYDTVKKLTT